MPYLYGLADTKFVKKKKIVKPKVVNPTKFHQDDYLAGKPYYDRNDIPLIFKTTPVTLVELCLNVIDKFPIPSVFDWGELDVMHWLARYGYPQYRNTFRVNFVTGRKLLLTDASALSTMNIKDFDHIRHITRGIRQLHNFEKNRLQFEMFKMFRTRTGVTYDEMRRSDLWRKMQLIREAPLNLQHWELLELWLRRQPVRDYYEIIGLVVFPRTQPVNCDRLDTDSGKVDKLDSTRCCKLCIPPCECSWEERYLRLPWRLTCLGQGLHSVPSKWAVHEGKCDVCIPPCECRWPPRYYLTGTVIKCLQQTFPEKFSPTFDERIKADVRPSLVERWTRFSF